MQRASQVRNSRHDELQPEDDEQVQNDPCHNGDVLGLDALINRLDQVHYEQGDDEELDHLEL